MAKKATILPQIGDGFDDVMNTLLFSNNKKKKEMGDIVMIENEVSLKFCGPKVTDGSIDIDDLIDSLKGFQKVYETTHNFTTGKNCKSTLTIKAFEKGSFETLIQTVVDNSGELLKLAVPTLSIIASVITIITTKKHISAEVKKIDSRNNAQVIFDNSFNINVQLSGNIENRENEKHIINNLLVNKNVRMGLSAMTKPLQEGDIEEMIFKYSGDSGQNTVQIPVSVSDHFLYNSSDQLYIMTDRKLIIDNMQSLDKKTLKGKLIYKNKTHPFKLRMDNPEDYFHFFTHQGKLQIVCSLKYDSDDIEKIVNIDVYDIQIEQNH